MRGHSTRSSTRCVHFTWSPPPAFRSPADLERQVGERLRGIAAEDLAPWTKLGSIVFLATKVVHAGNEVTVTARVHSDDVAHALETAAPNDFGAGEEYRFTWARALSPCSSGEHREHHDDRAFQVDAAAIGDRRWAPRQHA